MISESQLRINGDNHSRAHLYGCKARIFGLAHFERSNPFPDGAMVFGSRYTLFPIRSIFNCLSSLIKVFNVGSQAMTQGLNPFGTHTMEFHGFACSVSD